MKIITMEDIRDVYIKFLQRGISFLVSKFTVDPLKRTKSAFNKVNIGSSNWWIIPEVKKRWNTFITGDANTSYEEYLSGRVNSDMGNVKLLSIGSGTCSHEIKLASLNPGWTVYCLDVSENLLQNAREIADEMELKNIFFVHDNAYHYDPGENTYDIVMFHSSLHHFKNIKHFLQENVNSRLRPGGKLIINEYVGPNRLQYSKKQIQAINEALLLIDKPYRRIHKTNIYKNRYYGSGLLRMMIADPSECVDSESILPVIHENYKVIVERPYGGNILMSCLKDIAHHFVKVDENKKRILQALFAKEDEYLQSNKSDFLFAIYERV
jgi:ubiquinone/menaquinone biosynthesis C-methylase UbiE